MALIQVTPEELRADGNSFKQYGEEIQAIVAKCDRLKNKLLDEWKGSSSNAFMNQYDQLHPSMENFYKVVGEIGAQVNSIADTVEQTDQDIAAKIGF